MDLTVLFNLAFVLVTPFWALLIVAPRWTWSQRLVASPWTAMGPALIYVWLVLPILGEVLAAFSPPSVAGVAALLGTPEGATLAFAHFIAFDYFVGRWMALDALSRDIHPLLMAPLLVATLMVGPLGFAAYLVLRSGIAATRGELAQSFVDPITHATQA